MTDLLTGLLPETVIFTMDGGTINSVGAIMKRKTLTIFLLAASCISLAAENHYTNREDLDNQIKAYLKSQNLPLPNSGIQIVSASELSGSDSEIKKDMQLLKEQRENGYVVLVPT